MRKLLTTMVTMALTIGLVALLAPAGCGGDNGPRIDVGQNVRNLCNYTLSGVREESRCPNDAACPQVDEFCWQPEPDGAATCAVHGDCGDGEVCYEGFCYPGCESDADCSDGEANVKCVANGDAEGTKACRVHGYCRQCGADGQCESGICDNGWCHGTCTIDDNCDPGEMCTGGVCRPPHVADFSFTNVGDRDLEIYPNQTIVRGDADAAVFCDYEWDSSDDPIVLAPDDTAMLRIRFRPEDLGVSRAWVEVYSNDKTLNPLPLVMCGEALTAECTIAYDGSCPECPSCTDVDFQGYDTKDPVCQ